MRWVLMVFVILAAVMGGEARAVVGTGRVVVSERVEKAAVERESEALRGASLGAVLVAEEAAGVEDAGPLVLWFPGGLAVARSDGLSGTGTTGCRRVSSTAWRYDLADNRVARTETEERRVVNSTSWVRTAAADQRCLYRNAAGTGPNGRNQLSQSWETRTRWDAESGAPLELSEQTVSYRYDPRGNRTRRTTRLWKQARTTGSAAWPVPTVTDTDEALEWDGENRLSGMWRGPWKEELAQVPFESLVGEAVAGSTVWRWGYDYRSRRVQRDEPGSGGERLRTVTVFSGGTSAAEYTVTAGSAWAVPSAATVQHVRGPDLGGGTKGLLYSLRNGLPRFNRYNGRGDVVAQSDIDGTTTWAASYQADGRRTAEAGTNVERHRACTKEEDPTGLLNEGFRYRDLETGTFISRDPLGFVDGPNVYCYVGQNPWSAFDPEGLYAESGHYYTTFLVARAAGCDVRGAQMLAEYSQEPDENRGLTALELTAEWVAFTYAESPADLRFHQFSLHMLHGKRGGKLESARSAIRGVVADRSESLAVRGAFIHALGDSYSHTYLGGGGDRLRDYVPEIESAVQVGYGADTLKSSLKSNFGHGGDFTKPDQIGERPKLYMSFVADLYAALGGKTAPEKSLLESSVVMEDLHKMVMSNGFKAANGHDQEVVFFRDLARKHGLPWTPMPPESHNADHGFWAGIGLSRDQRSYNYYMIRKKQDEVVKKMSDQ